MKSELHEIVDMSNEKGIAAMNVEEEFHLSGEGEHAAFVEKLRALPGHRQGATTVFVNHEPIWRWASRSKHADSLSYWRKRKYLPEVTATVAPAGIKLLESAISLYYSATEERGMHCKVEPNRHGKLDYFFALPEDYAQDALEWKGNQIRSAIAANALRNRLRLGQCRQPARSLSLMQQNSCGTATRNFRRPQSLEQKELPEDPLDKRI